MPSPAHPDEIDTIVAISTPPGRGGIGIVRLAGPQAIPIAAQLLRLKTPLDDPTHHAHARRAQILDLTDPNPAAVLDDALVTVFHAPHSYTADTIVEIAAHGSPIVLDATLRAAMSLGARLAQPGEFTQRALLSGRLDLTQAEAVHDLIAAQTLDQARVAAQQLGGALARQIAPAKESLLHLIALLEAGMDFASGELDDVDVVPQATIAEEIANAHEPLQALAATFQRGQLLRDGASLALIGHPNAGKSSLFNRLLERERAIVTPLPGTTRDTVEEALALGGVPLRLIDTAGLRELSSPTSCAPHLASEMWASTELDEAEQLGIARSREALADADLVLLVHDATQPLSPAEQTLATQLASRPHLLIWNKTDLLSAPIEAATAIHTSALTGTGLDNLRSAILKALHAEGSLADTAMLNNARQHEHVTAALAALANAAQANAAMPHEIILLDLHSALRSLDALTGATTTDDILGRIFATFCIGK